MFVKGVAPTYVANLIDRITDAVRDWRATGSARDAVELARICRLPRKQAARARLSVGTLEIVDGASFVAMYREIFGRGIYRFEAARPDPLVLDVGANVGLSVLYFKKLYPGARVRAFEADPEILRVLERNLSGLHGVEIVGRAAWVNDGTLRFHREGADSGRIHGLAEALTVEVPCTRLRDHLAERIDLLKMDIEGAEVEVLADCASQLGCVDRIFVEYHSFARDRQRLPELVSVLASAGFRVWVENLNRVASPLVNRPEYLGMDLQLNVFGTRP